jgi:hypothetical protein
VNSEEVRTWIEEASFLRLENCVLRLSDEGKQECLAWAQKYLYEGNDPVKMKWAVAIVGTLAPDELDDDDEILDEKETHD